MKYVLASLSELDDGFSQEAESSIVDISGESFLRISLYSPPGHMECLVYLKPFQVLIDDWGYLYNIHLSNNLGNIANYAIVKVTPEENIDAFMKAVIKAIKKDIWLLVKFINDISEKLVYSSFTPLVGDLSGSPLEKGDVNDEILACADRMKFLLSSDSFPPYGVLPTIS